MKTLLICGYFENEYQSEVLNKSKSFTNTAANIFQGRLIQGLRQFDLKIISAPFLAPYPTEYKDIYFNGFPKNDNSDITYIPFNNIWGYRNISRTANLKKEVKRFINEYPTEKKSIIVYSVHTPFLEAAVYAKQLDPSIHICMVALDLPQYMNLNKNNRFIYDCFKKIDIKRFYKLNKCVDSYVLLTRNMAHVLAIGKRPYIVVEGIAEPKRMAPIARVSSGKKIAYAGKLVESFGVKNLLDAFALIKDKDAALDICGDGEMAVYVTEQARKDPRIHYHGTVSAQESYEILSNSDILVNPRPNNEIYTKYSFPSKNIEYLQTGNKVIAYMLDGIPEVYKNFFIVPQDDSIQALCTAITECFAMSEQEQSDKYEHFRKYVQNLFPAEVAQKIKQLIYE